MMAASTSRKSTGRATDSDGPGAAIMTTTGPAAGWSFTFLGSIPVPTAAASPDWRLHLGTDADGRAGYWLWAEASNRSPWAVWRVPVVVEHVIRRDGDGRPRSRVYLIAANTDPDSPRELVTPRMLCAGEYGAAIGLSAPADRKLCELIATSVIIQPCDVISEAIPQVDGSGCYTPLSPDVLPSGYGQCSAAGEAECLAAWKEAAQIISANPRLALVLGMSVVAPFIAPLYRQPRMLNLTGEARQGKTTGIQTAAAWWGHHGGVGQTGVVQSWNASALGIPQFLGRLGVMPAYLNEAGATTLDTAKRMALVYSIVDGNTRLTGTVDSLGRTTAGWGSAIISTSNASMLGTAISAGAGAGIPARLIELYTPFTRDETDATALAGMIRTSYGHPGRLTLARYSVEDVQKLIEWAADRLPIPAGATVTRTIMEHWHDAVAGAVMADVILGTGTLIQSAALAAVREIDLVEPPVDAELVIDEIRDRIASTPAEWPTQSLYAEWHRPREATAFGLGRSSDRPEMLQHGITQTVAGIIADDGSWLAVLPGAWKAVMETCGTDSGVVCEWLDRKGLIRVAPSARRKKEWQTVVATPIGSKRAYKLVISPDPEPGEVSPEAAAELVTAPAGDLAADATAVAGWLDRLAAAIDAATDPQQLESDPCWSDLADTVASGMVTADQVARLRARAERRRDVLTAPAAPIPAPRTAEQGDRQGDKVDSNNAGQGRENARKARAARPVAAEATDAMVYAVAGRSVVGGPEPVELATDLPGLLAALAAGPAGEVSVMLTDPALYGLTGKKPAVNVAWHKGFKPATDAGWHAEGDFKRRPNVGAWTNLQHPEHGTVRLCVLPWLTTADPFPYAAVRSESGAMVLESAGEVDPAELVRRGRTFAERATVTYRGTRANSAVSLFRDSIAATAQRQPRWHTAADLDSTMDQLDWVWTTPDPAATAGTAVSVFGFDGNKNHLYPTREVRLCMEELTHTGPIPYDPKLAGVFRIIVPVWPYPMLPAPTSQSGKAWVTAPILKLYAQLGFEVTILESWSGPGVQPQGSRTFVDTVAAALTASAGEVDAAIDQAVKGLYQTLHGKLRASSSRIRRADWGLSIRDESWCNTLRRVYTIAGILSAGAATGKPPVGPFPLYVDMDEIVYATGLATHADLAATLPGIVLGTGLGQFKPKTNTSIDQWMSDRKGGE